MEDTADTLPKLLKFQKLVSVSPLTAGEIQISCGAYGKKMIDRSFVWVAKSGGTSQPVSRHTSTQEREANLYDTTQDD